MVLRTGLEICECEWHLIATDVVKFHQRTEIKERQSLYLPPSLLEFIMMLFSLKIVLRYIAIASKCKEMSE